MNYFRKTTRIVTFSVAGKDSLYVVILQELIVFGVRFT